jgi:hypothetical protein
MDQPITKFNNSNNLTAEQYAKIKGKLLHVLVRSGSTSLGTKDLQMPDYSWE